MLAKATVYLVRHGQTDNNLLGGAGTFGGDLPLTQLGARQVRGTAQKLAAKQCNASLIVSSPLKRTVQTAEIVAEVLRIPIKTDQRLVEFNAGDWSLRPIKDVVADYAKIPLQQRPSFRPPGGESWLDIAQRMRAVIEDAEGEDVILVSHSSPILFCVGSLLGKQPETWLDGPEFGNGSGLVLRYDQRVWRCQDDI